MVKGGELMIYNRKIEVVFSKEDEVVLDSQSKKLNWLYNKLLDIHRDDYQNHGNSLQLTKGRNFRDYATKLKNEEFHFLETVHSSPFKNSALRLKEAFDRKFKGLNQFPKFRSWKKKWFSLYYDEPNKGFKVNGKELKISLGKFLNEETGKKSQRYVFGVLKDPLDLSAQNVKLKTFRLCKENKRFYAIFTLEKEELPIGNLPSNRWISIDQNHKNFFVAIDSEGQTFEFENLYQTKYFDKQIDVLKSKRDKCERKSIKKETVHGTVYYLPSKRYKRLDKALDKLYQRRREQIKSNLYQMAHWLCEQYELIVIGDYVPSKATAKYDKMHRGMLNQSHIGEFRNILSWVAQKSYRQCRIVDEKNTTKTCSCCGHQQKKDPDIREFICPSCETYFLRDVNSAINIAKKAKLTLKHTQSVGRIDYNGEIKPLLKDSNDKKYTYKLLVI